MISRPNVNEPGVCALIATKISTLGPLDRTQSFHVSPGRYQSWLYELKGCLIKVGSLSGWVLSTIHASKTLSELESPLRGSYLIAVGDRDQSYSTQRAKTLPYIRMTSFFAFSFENGQTELLRVTFKVSNWVRKWSIMTTTLSEFLNILSNDSLGFCDKLQIVILGNHFS